MAGYETYQPRRGSGIGGGILLIVVGLIFLVNQIYGINLFGVFGTVVGTTLGSVLQYWPVLLILAGAAVILRRD